MRLDAPIQLPKEEALENQGFSHRRRHTQSVGLPAFSEKDGPRTQLHALPQSRSSETGTDLLNLLPSLQLGEFRVDIEVQVAIGVDSRFLGADRTEPLTQFRQGLGLRLRLLHLFPQPVKL